MTEFFSQKMTIKPYTQLDLECPTRECGALMARWELPRVHDPAGPFIQDGDIIPGMSQRVGWTGQEPWHFTLELTRPCRQCGQRSVMASACVMSVKHIRPASAESRLLFNVEPGDEEFFQCSSPEGNWKMIEYKSPLLPPLQYHLIGPLLLIDEQSLSTPWGVSACSDSPDFQNAAHEILRKWEFIKVLAEERQHLWEKTYG